MERNQTNLRPSYFRIRFAIRSYAGLHFGNYGGLPLKIIWALLDLIAIVVLVSGIYLWLKKRNLPFELRLGLLPSEKENTPSPVNQVKQADSV